MGTPVQENRFYTASKTSHRLVNRTVSTGFDFLLRLSTEKAPTCPQPETRMGLSPASVYEPAQVAKVIEVGFSKLRAPSLVIARVPLWSRPAMILW